MMQRNLHCFLLTGLLLMFSNVGAEESPLPATGKGVAAAHKESKQDISGTEIRVLGYDDSSERVRSELEAQNRLIDQIHNRVGDLSFGITVFGLVITIVGAGLGLLGYATVSAKAQAEAKKAAEDWLDGQVFKRKLEEFDGALSLLKAEAEKKAEGYSAQMNLLYERITPQRQDVIQSVGQSERVSLEQALEEIDDSKRTLEEILKKAKRAIAQWTGYLEEISRRKRMMTLEQYTFGKKLCLIVR